VIRGPDPEEGEREPSKSGYIDYIEIPPVAQLDILKVINLNRAAVFGEAVFVTDLTNSPPGEGPTTAREESLQEAAAVSTSPSPVPPLDTVLRAKTSSCLGSVLRQSPCFSKK
jgi:hypothetical protein